MLNLTTRDHRLIRFIDDFNAATTTQIHKLFFSDVSLRRCQDRLTILQGWNYLVRDRDSLNTDFVYYIKKKPDHLMHDLCRTEFYCYLDSHYQLAEFFPEYELSGIKADAYFEVYRNGLNTPYFLEVQVSPCFRQQKYEDLYKCGSWIEVWPEFPTVIVVSDCKLRFQDSPVRYVQYPCRLTSEAICS